MEELISFLFAVILIFYVVRALARIFLPMFFQRVVNKAQQQQQQYQRPNYNNYNNTPPTGKVKVDYVPKQKKGSVPDSEGEFIDFEEVK